MKMWMFNCQEVSRLVSESMDRDLSLAQKMGIRFHLMMCRYCARFVNQLRRMRELMRGYKDDTVPPLTMDQPAKDKLKQVVDEACKHKHP